MKTSGSKILTIIILTALGASLLLSGCKKEENSSAPVGAEGSQTSELCETSDGDSSGPKVEHTFAFTDARGKDVTVNREPKRAICLYGSYMDLWYQCGGTLIGRIGTYTTHEIMPEVEAVPVIAETSSEASLEVIIDQEPDLVILYNSKDDIEKAELLESQNIPCIAVNYQTFDEYLDLVKIFTEINNRPDLYEEHATKNKERVDAVIEKVQGHSAEVVLIMPSATSGPNFTSMTTMCGHILQDLNAVNVVYPDGDYSQKAPDFSMEKLIELDPQYILTYGGGDDQEAAKQRVLDLPGWGELTAVKGRYKHLDISLYMFKPNIRYAEAYEKLAGFLYPELFPEFAESAE